MYWYFWEVQKVSFDFTEKENEEIKQKKRKRNNGSQSSQKDGKRNKNTVTIFDSVGKFCTGLVMQSHMYLIHVFMVAFLDFTDFWHLIFLDSQASDAGTFHLVSEGDSTSPKIKTNKNTKEVLDQINLLEDSEEDDIMATTSILDNKGIS